MSVENSQEILINKNTYYSTISLCILNFVNKYTSVCTEKDLYVYMYVLRSYFSEEECK